MSDAKQILDLYFLEMRWRCLSLAADLDRVERGERGPALLKEDPRVAKLQRALEVLRNGAGNRAEQVEMIFSDMSPPPPK